MIEFKSNDASYDKLQLALDAIIDDSTQTILKRLSEEEHIDVEACKEIIRAEVKEAAEKTQLVMALA